MYRYSRSLAGIALFGFVFALAAWCARSIAQDDSAQKETSVVVEKQAVPAADGPSLPPPANQLTLPPPAKPNTAPATKQPTANSVKRPFLRPAEPKRAAGSTPAELTSAEEPMPTPAPAAAPSGGEVVVQPAPPIEYDTDGDARDMYRHFGQVDLVMVTLNPADGCLYEIPMCVPACCTDEPIVSSGRGIFGRGVVEYCWACGFRAEVKFRHILGDVKVEYEGD